LHSLRSKSLTVVILKTQSTAGALADRLRQEIADGVPAAGQALPQEELSARFGVSRSPLREALHQLQAEGWVTYHPNRGAFVTRLSAQDVRELYGVRRILEGGAARLAAASTDPGVIARARNVERTMYKELDAAAFIALHQQFHRTVYESTGNPKLVEAIAKHYVQVQRVAGWQTRLDAIRRCSRSDHRELLAACERHDADAAEAAAIAHVDHLEAIVLRALDSKSE